MHDTVPVPILIGTSGFSFSDWSPSFYPADLPKARWLEHYVKHFPTLELNTSYYGIPSAATIGRLCDQTPPSYPIIVKANQETTHRHNDEQIADEFRAALQPLVETGRLKGVLAQFPWSFRSNAENRRYIADMVKRSPGFQWFIEFRRREWIVPAVGDMLRELGAGYVSVDEPQIGGMVPPVAKSTTPTAYVRLHGRNAANWWDSDPKAGKDRYDYLYNKEELESWIRKIGRLVKEVKEVFVFFNNCRDGQATRNASEMRTLVRTLQETAREGFENVVVP